MTGNVNLLRGKKKKKKKHEYAIKKKAYLCHIFENLNALDLNTSLKRCNMRILILAAMVLAFRNKLQQWRKKMNEDVSKDCFQLLEQFVIFNEADFSCNIERGIIHSALF